MRLTDLLEKQRNRACLRISEQECDEVLGGEIGLVAGRDGVRHAQPLGRERDAQGAGERAALRDHADSGAAGNRLRRDGFEGQCHAVGEIGKADAVRPEHANAARARGRDQPLLLGAALVADLGKSGREHDCAPDASPAAGRDRIDHCLLRHDQDRRVDAAGQLVDRGHARAPVDLLGPAADEMDVAAITAALEIDQHGTADRAGLRGRAHDCDRSRPHQAHQPTHIV